MSDYLHSGISLYLDQLVDWDSYFRLKKGEDVDVQSECEALQTVLETMAEICSNLEPQCREEWDLAPELVDGKVIRPARIERAISEFREAGLVGLGVEEEYGGFGMPSFICNVFLEMMSRADAGLMTIMGLQTGVAEDIERFGSKELCERYLPGFTTGEYEGAMDLTEPQAGSDLGAILTKATERDGRIFLTGQKIFITNGNAQIHMVLARDADTFDETKGSTKGLSLYLCPMELPDGSDNPMRVERLEHKLGIHGSPTAVMQYDDAEAFLVGTKGDGLKAMLELMNNARLGVASQGLGIAEAALTEAINYSRERKQFGFPIGDQPLMKSMLARMAMQVEGSRALLYRGTALADRTRAQEVKLARDGESMSATEKEELEAHLKRNNIRVRLLTPLVKYLCTECCDSVTRKAIQVHGGVGFMAESTVGKLHLDGIITTIYEGTSEIQVSFALKEIGKGGLHIVFEEIEEELSAMTDAPRKALAERVRQGIASINEASGALLKDFNYALFSARHLADTAICVIVSTELLKQAGASEDRMSLAAGWIEWKMPELEMHAQRIREGEGTRIEQFENIIKIAE